MFTRGYQRFNLSSPEERSVALFFLRPLGGIPRLRTRTRAESRAMSSSRPCHPFKWALRDVATGLCLRLLGTEKMCCPSSYHILPMVFTIGNLAGNCETARPLPPESRRVSGALPHETRDATKDSDTRNTLQDCRCKKRIGIDRKNFGFKELDLRSFEHICLIFCFIKRTERWKQSK